MGAHDIFMTVKGDKTEEEVKARYYERKEDDRDYYGNDPYNGTFSTLGGIDIRSLSFSTRDEAEEYILNKTDKWGNAIAVRVINDAENYWLIGGWAAS